jgi:hypothetical protein
MYSSATSGDSGWSAAFLIQHSAATYALDTGEHAENMAEPHLWSSHWAPWQQWIICALPLN